MSKSKRISVVSIGDSIDSIDIIKESICDERFSYYIEFNSEYGDILEFFCSNNGVRVAIRMEDLTELSKAWLEYDEKEETK